MTALLNYGIIVALDDTKLFKILRKEYAIKLLNYRAYILSSRI